MHKLNLLWSGIFTAFVLTLNASNRIEFEEENANFGLHQTYTRKFKETNDQENLQVANFYLIRGFHEQVNLTSSEKQKKQYLETLYLNIKDFFTLEEIKDYFNLKK